MLNMDWYPPREGRDPLFCSNVIIIIINNVIIYNDGCGYENEWFFPEFQSNPCIIEIQARDKTVSRFCSLRRK